MTVQNISRSISTKECCQTSRDQTHDLLITSRTGIRLSHLGGPGGGGYTNITVNSCNTKRISSLEKSLSEKYVHIPGCQENGAFHTGIQKNRAIHILFVEKRGPIIYLAELKKGAIRHAHPYYAPYIGS